MMRDDGHSSSSETLSNLMLLNQYRHHMLPMMSDDGQSASFAHRSMGT
jgi:hypothetical protein